MDAIATESLMYVVFDGDLTDISHHPEVRVQQWTSTEEFIPIRAQAVVVRMLQILGRLVA
jgi:hypothetical protein